MGRKSSFARSTNPILKEEYPLEKKSRLLISYTTVPVHIRYSGDYVIRRKKLKKRANDEYKPAH